MGNNPKLHHYIPQMLLKRFTDDAGKLYAVKKQSPHQIIRTIPKKLFSETHLYTQVDEKGFLDVSVEKQFSKLESNAEPVVKKIISMAREGKKPSLTSEEKRIWDEFFYRLWIRLPQVRDRLGMEDLFQGAVHELEKKYAPISEQVRNGLVKKKSRIMKNAWVSSVGILNADDSEVMQILEGKGLAVGVLRNHKKSFVIGSLPIMKKTLPNRTHLADPNVEALLPIAHDIIVTPGCPPGEEIIINIDDGNHVRSLNRSMFSQSDWIAGRSHALIKSLSHPQ